MNDVNKRIPAPTRGINLGGKMATSTAQSGSASVEDCEDYIEKHGIQGILKECIAKICQEQPANPYKWLSTYFSALDVKKVHTSSARLSDVILTVDCRLDVCVDGQEERSMINQRV